MLVLWSVYNVRFGSLLPLSYLVTLQVSKIINKHTTDGFTIFLFFLEAANDIKRVNLRRHSGIYNASTMIYYYTNNQSLYRTYKATLYTFT